MLALFVLTLHDLMGAIAFGVIGVFILVAFGIDVVSNVCRKIRKWTKKS
jgi:hypothetical protein